MSKGSKQTGTKTVTHKTDIPSFLQPITRQSAGAQGRALTALEDLLGQGFSPLEQQAQQIMIERGLGSGGFIPTAQEQFLRTAQGVPVDSFAPDFSIDPTAREALQQTAQGDFLFGGQGFNEAVDAAVRRVQPNILSTFGAAGRGTGGLAQQAIAQATSDAFANLFGQERQRQLGAASQLGQFDLSRAGTLSSLANQERSRQLQAAGALPQVGLAGADILSRVGSARRALPISNYQQLLGASQGIFPITSAFGQTQSQPIYTNKTAGILGGALSGLGLGASTAAEGATGLAALGGPLGIGLGIGGGLLGAFL